MSELDRAVAELLGRRIVPFVKENLDPGYDVPGVMHFDELTLVDDKGYLYVCDEDHSYQDCDPENFLQLFSPSTDANQAQAAVREWAGTDDMRRATFRDALYAVTAPPSAVPKDNIQWWSEQRDYSASTATPEQLCRALIAAAKEDKR